MEPARLVANPVTFHRAAPAVSTPRPPRKAFERRPIRPVAVAAGVALIFLGMVALAQLTGHWQTKVSDDQYLQLIPNASQFGHPGATGR